MRAPWLWLVAAAAASTASRAESCLRAVAVEAVCSYGLRWIAVTGPGCGAMTGPRAAWWAVLGACWRAMGTA